MKKEKIYYAREACQYGKELAPMSDMFRYVETDRELDVIRGLSFGMNVEDIADELEVPNGLVNVIRMKLENKVMNEGNYEKGALGTAASEEEILFDTAIYMYQKEADIGVLLSHLEKVQKLILEHPLFAIRWIYVDVNGSRGNLKRCIKDMQNEKIEALAVFSLAELGDSLFEVLHTVGNDLPSMNIEVMSVAEEYFSLDERLCFTDEPFLRDEENADEEF